MAKRGKVTQLPGAHVAHTNVNTVALGSDDDQVVWQNKTGYPVNVIEVVYTPDTDVTGNDDNSLLLRLLNRLVTGGAASNVTALKDYATGVDLTAFVASVLVVSTTAADTRIEDEECLILQKTEDGTGLALPAGVVTVVYEFI